MSTNSRILKKSYAMQRMARAIERAVSGATVKEKERAARWVGAWGMLCGIRSKTVRLRRSEVGGDERTRQPTDQIEIPAEIASGPVSAAGTDDLVSGETLSPESSPERSDVDGGGVAFH